MSSLTDPNANSYFSNYGLYGLNPSTSSNVGYAQNLTQPFGNTNPNSNLMATGQVQAPQVQSFNQNQTTNQGSSGSGSNASGLNPNAVTNLASTAAQHGLSTTGPLQNLENTINNFGAENLGFANQTSIAATQAGLTGSDAAALGSTGNFVNAAGDSVAANALPWSTDAVAGQIGADGSTIATGAVAQGAADAATSGSLFGTATLSGTLGAAGLGAIGGGILAHALGENSTGGSVGGAIGAAAGYALGGAGAAALGLELGSFAGPVGAIVGGIGGAIFGGLFGNSSPGTNASGEGGSLTASGALSGVATGGKNPNSTSSSTVSTATQNFSSLAEAANTQLGIQFSPDVHFQANYSSKHGGTNINVSGPNGQSSGPISFNPQDASSSQQAYLQALTLAAQYSGYTNTNQINSWYQQTYINSNAGASNLPPTLPNNPNASAGTTSFQQFLTNYKAQQNANAAPTQTTIGTASS